MSVDSAPRITAIQVADSEIILEFNAKENKRYWLEQSVDLTNWMTLQHQESNQSGVIQWKVDKSGPIGFFRIRAEAL